MRKSKVHLARLARILLRYVSRIDFYCGMLVGFRKVNKVTRAHLVTHEVIVLQSTNYVTCFYIVNI